MLTLISSDSRGGRQERRHDRRIRYAGGSGANGRLADGPVFTGAADAVATGLRGGSYGKDTLQKTKPDLDRSGFGVERIGSRPNPIQNLFIVGGRQSDDMSASLRSEYTKSSSTPLMSISNVFNPSDTSMVSILSLASVSVSWTKKFSISLPTAAT